MARQRFIHPDFWSDPTIGKLDTIERLLFIGCFSNADDEGRLLGNAAFLRSTIFPYDDFTIQQVTDMRDRMVSLCKNVVYYIVDGVEYLAFTKWDEYQKPRYPKPSKFPPPPDQDMDETLQPNSCKPSETLQPDDGKPASLDRVGLGRVGVGSGDDKPAAAEMIDDDSVSPLKFYEQTFGVLCPPISLEVIDEFADKGLQPSALKWAIREQKLSDGRGPKYLQRIMQRLLDDGLLTAEAAEAHERERNAKPRASPGEDDTPGLNSALRSARKRLQEAGKGA